jgi:hypothetical protein
MRSLLLAAVALAALVPSAQAGGITVCSNWGCRSIALPNFTVHAIPQRAPPPVAAVPPPRRSRPNVQVPPPDDATADKDAAEAKGIEDDIEAFCDKHPDEQFCGRLGLWLRKHPRKGTTDGQANVR